MLCYRFHSHRVSLFVVFFLYLDHGKRDLIICVSVQYAETRYCFVSFFRLSISNCSFVFKMRSDRAKEDMTFLIRKMYGFNLTPKSSAVLVLLQTRFAFKGKNVLVAGSLR